MIRLVLLVICLFGSAEAARSVHFFRGRSATRSRPSPPPVAPIQYPDTGVQILHGFETTRCIYNRERQYAHNGFPVATQCCGSNGECRWTDFHGQCLSGAYGSSSFQSATWSEASRRCKLLGLELCDKICETPDTEQCLYDHTWVWTNMSCPAASPRSTRSQPLTRSELNCDYRFQIKQDFRPSQMLELQSDGAFVSKPVSQTRVCMYDDSCPQDSFALFLDNPHLPDSLRFLRQVVEYENNEYAGVRLDAVVSIPSSAEIAAKPTAYCTFKVDSQYMFLRPEAQYSTGSPQMFWFASGTNLFSRDFPPSDKTYHATRLILDAPKKTQFPFPSKDDMANAFSLRTTTPPPTSPSPPQSYSPPLPQYPSTSGMIFLGCMNMTLPPAAPPLPPLAPSDSMVHSLTLEFSVAP